MGDAGMPRQLLRTRVQQVIIRQERRDEVGQAGSPEGVARMWDRVAIMQSVE